MSKPAVICVDDERIVLEALKSQLKNRFSRKFDIYITESAEEARELIEELLEEGDSVHCVVSDAIMPGESGPHFLMDLHGSHPEIKKILLTGQVTESEVDQALKSGALTRRMTKPWQEEELINTIGA